MESYEERRVSECLHIWKNIDGEIYNYWMWMNIPSKIFLWNLILNIKYVSEETLARLVSGEVKAAVIW